MRYFKDAGNEVYAYDNKQVSDGLADGKTEITESEMLAITTPALTPIERRKLIEYAIMKHIQNEVDTYNEANALSFKDIYSCGLYRTMTGYTHQAFCNAIWEWQTSVWEYARAELYKVMGGSRTEPTADEFILELPPFVMP